MAITLQDRFSPLVDAKLRYTIVQKDGVIWNTKFEGTPKAGAVKVPVRDTEASVTAYDKQNGAAKSYTAGSYVTVAVDKDYAVNEVLDGYDAAAVPDNIVADRLDSAGYSMGLQINTDGTKELLNGTTVNTTAAITKSTIYEKFVDCRTAMSKGKIPIDGRFALINPDFVALILKSPEFISASSLGDDVKQSGAIGRIAGFTCFEDATLPTNVSAICGHPEWCCRVTEWAVPVHIQDLSGSGAYIGASAIQGRKVYAHKLTKTDTVKIISAVLDPAITITSHSATIVAGTNGTSVKYRMYDLSATTWGDWTTYSGAITTAAGDIIEAYSVDADGTKSGTASKTDA
jgi:hypothetical protein